MFEGPLAAIVTGAAGWPTVALPAIGWVVRRIRRRGAHLDEKVGLILSIMARCKKCHRSSASLDLRWFAAEVLSEVNESSG